MDHCESCRHWLAGPDEPNGACMAISASATPGSTGASIASPLMMTLLTGRQFGCTLHSPLAVGPPEVS